MLITPFVGREKELSKLKASWQVACGGKPQIVNLIADTGVGKTRIVHAFYSWLSAQARKTRKEGQQPYWPAALGVHRQRSVNPQEEQFGAFDFENDIIPWLWWGMYWTDVDGEQATALNQFSGHLSNHLLMLELEEKSKQKNLKAFWQMVTDEGFDIVSDFVPGISQVKKLATFFLKMKARRDEKKRLSKGLSSEQEHQLDDIQNELLSSLDKLYIQKESQPVVPLILFLDDIHFATDKRKDEETLSFLEKLLNTAVSNKWPLLVITTHWKSPWQAHLNDKSLSDSKPWRRIVEGIRKQYSDDVVGVHDSDVYNIYKDELDTVIQSTLPGLNQENRSLILSRVDNVRWLVEVLTALNDNVDHFEQRDRKLALSKYGLQRLDELLKSNGYIEVISQRLSSDMMTPLRPILGAAAWHTYGLDFLSPLIHPIGQVLAERKVLDAESANLENVIFNLVSKAIDPAAFLEGTLLADKLPNLLSFPERGYMDVARALFDESHLPSVREALAREAIVWLETNGTDEPRWKTLADKNEQRTFLEIARIVLQEVMPKLSDKQEEKVEARKEQYQEDGMEPAEIDEKIKAIRQKFLSENTDGSPEDAEALCVCCTIELIKLLCDAGEARAFSLAFELRDSGRLDEFNYQLVSTDALLELVRVLQEKKTCWAQAKKITGFLIYKYEALKEKPFGLAQLSRILVSQADLENESGNLKAARQGYVRSLHNLEGLLEQHGDRSFLLMDLSLTFRRLGALDKKSGDLAAARQTYIHSLEIAKRLLEKYGASPERLMNQCISLERLAGIELACNNLIEAQQSLEQCLAIFERLETEYGETAQRLRNQSITLMRLADLHKRGDDLAAARLGYELSLALSQRLMSQYGETPERLRDLNIIYTRMADLDLEADHIFKAYRCYTQSLEMVERLLTEYGEKPELLSDQIVVLMRLAGLDQIYDDLEAARKSYASCQTLAKRLLEQYGETPERLGDLRVTFRFLGELDQKNDDLVAARQNYEDCLALGERLLAQYGEAPDLLRDQNVILMYLADLDKTSGDLVAARQGYLKCLSLAERLLEQYGETSELLSEQYLLLMHLADIDKTSGDLVAARQGYLKCLTLAERLLEQYGEKPNRLVERSTTLKCLGELDQSDNDLVAARQSFELCLAIDKRLIVQFGETLERLQELEISHSFLADLEYASGNLVSARKGFQDCLELAVRMYNEYVDSPERLMGLYFAYVRLADLDKEIGDLTKALEGYEDGLKIIEYILEQYGEMVKWVQMKNSLLDRIALLNS